MKPRIYKVNKHRSFAYYTPEDVQKIILAERSSASSYAGCTLWRDGLSVTIVESKAIEHARDPDQAFCDMSQRALDSIAAAWDARKAGRS